MRVHPPKMPPIRTGSITDDDNHAKEEHAPELVTYTFLSETPALIEMDPADLSFTTAHDDSPPPTPQRTFHGKRRDASYIPRPPNAFILFRSSFIRDQKITNKVEGNHSNLSKIIGMCWKTLTREQRDEWEAKAAQALIEHRKRYPDWRFRLAANASSTNVKPKIKSKDGVRRGRARKDPPDGGGGGGEEESEQGSGKGRAMTRAEEEESRLTKIAGLLVEGQEGEALEKAVEEWEAERRMFRRSASVSTPESVSSSPVITRAFASTDRETTPSTFTSVMSLSSPMLASCSPIRTRARPSNPMEPVPAPPLTSVSVLSPSLSVAVCRSSSPVMTRASTTGRKSSISASVSSPSRFDILTPKDLSSPSSSRTPRLSGLTLTLSTSELLLKTPPSWPTSPIAQTSLVSTAPTSLLWPASPTTPRTPTSFPAFTRAEDWEAEHSLTRSNSVSISPSTLSSPVVTYATASRIEREVPSFMTRASSAMDLESTPPPPSTSSSVLSPSLSVSSSPVMTRASTMENELEPSTLTPAPSLSSIGISTPNVIPSPSSPSTPRSSVLTSTPSTPVSISKWPASPTTPCTVASTASTPVPWPASPVTPRISTSVPTFTRAEEWEVAQRVGHSMSKSVLSSPGISRASVSTTDRELSTSISTSESLSSLYSPPTAQNIPSPSHPSMSTATSSIPIPKSAPSWRASPSKPYAASISVWPTSPTTPCISNSFPTLTRAGDWEMGHRVTRSNSVSMSASALSSPITLHASPSTTNGEPSMFHRSPSVSTSCSPIMTQIPVSTSSWPASPVTSSPIAAQTPVPSPSWSTAPTSPVTPHVFDSTSTPILSRRSRPRSRSPVFRSPQNPNVPLSMKRSLSAPAPHRDHHRQQEPVRMDAGFWWPAPDEPEYSRSHADKREQEQEQEQEQKAMEMEMEMGEPTREGSYDTSSSQDQDTEHGYGIGGRETNEWVWNFDTDSKSTSTYSSIPLLDQITPTSTPTDFHQLEPSSPHDRWFNPWDADTTIHAGESLHPLPPTPISPSFPLSPSPFSTLPHTPICAPTSSFSSLAGWDGTMTEPVNANSSRNCAAVKATGIGGMLWGGGGLQRLAVQGGGYGRDCQRVG